MIDRRSVLGQAMAGVWAASMSPLAVFAGPARAEGDPAAPQPPTFTIQNVKAEAEKLSAAEFSKPTVQLPEPFNKLSYEQYRDIHFKPERSFWKGQKLDFELQPFAMGWLYDTPVDIFIVDEGTPIKLVADGQLYSIGPLIGSAPDAAPFGFSGFRLHSPINRADYFDEYVVFQGASYLRAVGRGIRYGASARGLAINTARPGGEEFPFFRAFWIEKPKPGATEIVVYALLDSPSTTGAYRFAIAPGETTVMDIDATLFPRKALEYVGLAPLTSMFMHGPSSQRRTDDYRPSVHDSEGLAILNGSGERLWRPLNNPVTLQTSAFMDKDPKGFGLLQRDRDFRDYEDLEARYDRRPTVWVEPRGSWGEGFIELIEIPVEEEIHDNVIAYWKPKAEMPAGQPFEFNYKIHWGLDVPVSWAGARVAKTRIGRGKKSGNQFFVVDIIGDAVKEIRDLPVAEVAGHPGQITNVVVQRNPEISGLRVSFELDPAGADLVELRLVLKVGDQAISETWLYRWTKP